MKKIKTLFICLFGAIIISSCSNETKERGIDVVERVPSYEGSKTVKIFKYEYEGHSYQFHWIGEGRTRTGGPIHDPNCKCFNDSL